MVLQHFEALQEGRHEMRLSWEASTDHVHNLFSNSTSKWAMARVKLTTRQSTEYCVSNGQFIVDLLESAFLEWLRSIFKLHIISCPWRRSCIPLTLLKRGLLITSKSWSLPLWDAMALLNELLDYIKWQIAECTQEMEIVFPAVL